MKLKYDERLCPKCAEPIKKAASKCKHCGSDVSPVLPTPTEKNTGAALGCGFLILLVLGVNQCGGGKTSNETAVEDKKVAAEAAENRRKGFHCLSGWDGSHPGLVDEVKAQLRDPESFEHVETRITPVNDKGNHLITMKYRARNGFGGMNVGTAIGTVRQSDCSASLALTDDN